MSFEATAEEAVRRIRERIENHIILISSTEALFEATGEIPTAQQFRTFVAKLQEADQFDGIQGIGFARYVQTGPSSNATIAAELGRNYGISRTPWPETTQPDRTPIVLIEPSTDRNRRALGFDMFSEPVRREAIIAAMNEERMRASGAVELVQENGDDKQAGFLIYTPFFAINSGRLLGFIYAPFRITNLFDSALNRVPVLPVHLTAWDANAETSSVIYQSIQEPRQDAKSFSVSSTLEVAGRTWTLTVEPSAAYEPPADQTRSVMLAIAGLLLAAALAASSRAQQHAIEVGETLRQESERALSDRELLLQEMKHRIKNMIARVMAISRQTARNSETLAEFSDSFGARLHAMAASQDLLARTAWQGADLRTLLVQELKQLFGDEFDEKGLNGPEVHLNEPAAQAFGLAFHELATNALKYGSARFDTGTLEISWFIQDVPAGKEHLVLKWSEHSLDRIDVNDAATPGKSGGFGTRLLDATMRIELGGSIETVRKDYGINVTIRVPYDRVKSTTAGPGPSRSTTVKR
ncbi:MAG: CHASE domain-containing protein [Hoeflea sp.]|uniref:CHASE domain-containing protein n=1 Tax=Hoeflea sp. TaxID=1940281 RepID=UPI0032ED425E